MLRFFLPPERCHDRIMVLKGAEAHHAARVLRMETGDAVVVLDGVGKAYQCGVKASSKASVTLEVRSVEDQPSPLGLLRLIAGIPKGQLFDEIVERATELGVSEIVPLMTERGNDRIVGQDALAKQEAIDHAARPQFVAHRRVRNRAVS